MFKTLLFSLTITISAFGQAPVDPHAEYLSKGLAAEKSNNPEEAIRIWNEARIFLEKPSFDIGFEYIRLVTQHSLKEHYPSASSAYFWGLEADTSSIDSRRLVFEFEMINNLLDLDDARDFKDEFKYRPAEMLQSVKNFWTVNDPTPHTVYNERLMEHWERIAYAKNTYSTNRKSDFGFDDRGISYIKYGKPDRIASGMLAISGSDVYNLVVRRMVTAGITELSEQMRAFARAMENTVQSIQSYPRYEMWIYNQDLDVYTDNNLVIHVERVSGRYDKIRTIDDIIEPSAYSLGNRFAYQSIGGITDLGMNPAILMQYLYYQQLSAVDRIFSDAFANIDFAWMRVGEAPRKETALAVQRYNTTRRLILDNELPKQETTLFDEFPTLPFNIKHYRFLDDNNLPYQLVFAESTPQEIFLSDLIFNQDSMFKSSVTPEAQRTIINDYYRLRHGVQVRDKEDWRLLSHEILAPPMILESGDSDDEPAKSIAIFRIPNASGDIIHLYYAELLNNHPDSNPKVDSPFQPNLRGYARIDMPQPQPLNTNPNELEVSDIVLGYDRDAYGPDDDAFLPFRVANDGKIPNGENLVVHYEVYHLQQDLNGIANFEVEYEVIKQGGIRVFRKAPRETQLRLSQQTDEKFYRENLEIEVPGLDAGKYKFIIKIKDTIAQKTIQRSFDFEVLEKEMPAGYLDGF